MEITVWTNVCGRTALIFLIVAQARAQDAVSAPRTAEAESVAVTGRADDLLGKANSAFEVQVTSEDLAARPVLRRGEV
jgi:hypothetical protein